MSLKKYIREVAALVGRALTPREERYCKDAFNTYVPADRCAQIIKETAY